MMCAEPAGIMEQEAAYLAALGGAAAYVIEGDQLTLLDASGTRMVQAQAVQAEVGAYDWTVVLKNLKYQSYITQSGTAPLVDGEYREPAAPGSAEETVVILTDSIATGDLNGDGVPDAAAVLATNTGGSGVFIDPGRRRRGRRAADQRRHRAAGGSGAGQVSGHPGWGNPGGHGHA
jgi:hypothetical protein